MPDFRVRAMFPKTLFVLAGYCCLANPFVLRGDDAKVTPTAPAPGPSPKTADADPNKDGGAESKKDGKNAEAAADDLFRKQQASIIGLLVATMAEGKFAGSASRMNVVAIPADHDRLSEVKFNQATGPMMTAALDEVRKYMTVRHGDWPKGKSIDISFEDKWTPKDGPSAAVACALLLDGLYTGTEWDPSLAVTGDMNSDGAVKKVGGVAAKIRGAALRKLHIVAVPAGNADAVRDFALMEGPQRLLNIQVFGLNTFNDARALARRDREEKTAAAITDFDAIMNAKPPGAALGTWIRQPAVLGRLRKVAGNAPNHLSASILLEFAEGGSSLTMSLAGSIQKIEAEAASLLAAIPQAKGSNLSGLRDDGLGDAVMRLRKVRARCHPETVKVIDSLDDFGTEIRAILKAPPRFAPAMARAMEKIQLVASRVDSAYSTLRNNPEVREELMKE